jgi:hypothetical protein
LLLIGWIEERENYKDVVENDGRKIANQQIESAHLERERELKTLYTSIFFLLIIEKISKKNKKKLFLLKKY